MVSPNPLQSTYGKEPKGPRLEVGSYNPNLCQQCQIWDDVMSVSAKWEHALSLVDLSSRTECVLCQAVASIVHVRRRASETFNPETSRILVINEGPSFLYTGADIRVEFPSPAEMVIPVVISLKVGLVQEESLSTIKASQAAAKFSLTPQFDLHYDLGEKTSLRSIKLWEVPFFHVSLLRTWLKGCETLLGGQCLGDGLCDITKLPRDFRVIDVHSRSVVKPTGVVRFVALSYMWQQNGDNHVQLEKGNLKDLEATGGISQATLPNIISDAISLCRELGETNLWVDRLCIVQDDADSKHAQIQGMDRIYRLASYTIIAALDTRDGAGLPGFCTRPRESSMWTPSREGHSASANTRGDPIDALVNPSLWNRRGWTFQERVLSRRRLYITESRVIYECAEGFATEELTVPPYEPHGRYMSDKDRHLAEQEYNQIPGFHKRINNDHIGNYNMIDTTSLLDYFHWVENYTSRQLSFRSDILEAFVGVGKALRQSLNSEMLFGLPEKYMSQALMWSTTGQSARRVETPHIPSWSWAAFVGQARYFWILRKSLSKLDIEKTASLVYFNFQDPELGLRRLNVSERWVGEEISLGKFRSVAEIPSATGDYMPDAERSSETWKECPHNPWETSSHLTLDPEACRAGRRFPGALVFNTTVASLRLEQDAANLSKDMKLSDSDVAICTDEGKRVGLLNKMSADWIDENVGCGKTHDFIVICGALADSASRRNLVHKSSDYDPWRLHVMMVERLSLETHVVRRVDVGVIEAHMWKGCCPRWETIVLC